MKLSAATWPTLSKLLDEAFDMEPAARATWLAELVATQPQLAPSLHKLLAADASSETGDVLSRLPKLPALSNEPRVTALSAGARVGPYRLKRELGAGGMADVWLAERADGALTREVALKLPLMNRLRRDLSQRFARERDILARLEHPRIARLYDAGVSADGLPYLAMEYVDGQPVTVYCDAHSLDIEARLRLFGQVLDAVQFAHASLVIHRDLKPSNILVTATGEVRLLDFGIAKLLAENDVAPETQLTQMAGRALTPDYASPEQIKGEPLSIATDVYSLGVVLYELLAGCRPYRLSMRSAAQLEDAIVSGEPDKPSSAMTDQAARARGTTVSRLSRKLSGDLDTIVLKALAKLPADRYLTIAAFADDLRRHLDGRPVLAQPTSWSYRAKKVVLRNKLVAGAASAVLLSLILGVGVATWQAQQARADQRRAEQVKAFLASIFVDIDPNYGQGGRVPASAILLKASSRIDKEFGEDPRLALEVATLVASGLFATNEHKSGGEIVETALQRYESRLSGSDPQTLHARRLAFGAHASQGTLTNVAAQLPEFIEKLRTASPPLTEDLVFALMYLASAELVAKRSESALALRTEAAEIARTRLGEYHRVSIETLSHLSHALIIAGKMSEAQSVAERGVKAAQAVYERPHPMISGLERRLANALMRTGKPRDAAALLDGVLRDERSIQGEGTIPVAEAEYVFGVALVFSGQIKVGLQHMKSADETLSRIKPNDHRNEWTRRIDLAGASAAARLPLQTLHWLEEAGRSAQAGRLADLDKALAPRRFRCFALTQLGRLDEAAAEYAALGPIMAQASRAEQARTSRCLALLARLQGHASDAVEAASSALAMQDGLHISAFERAAIRSELGLALLEAGNLMAADPALTASLAEFTDGQVGPSPAVMDVKLGLGRLALEQRRKAEAVAFLSETLSYWRDFDPEGLDAAVADYWHARASGLQPSAATMKTLRASPYPLHRKWIGTLAVRP